MESIRLSELKQIKTEGGAILKVLKSSDLDFSDFGEAYFSMISKNAIRGWKRHKKMTMNLVVPLGRVHFVFADDKESETKFTSHTLSNANYSRITVLPGTWFAFQGLEDLNLILNIANIEHDDSEVEQISLESMTYQWKSTDLK